MADPQFLPWSEASWPLRQTTERSLAQGWDWWSETRRVVVQSTWTRFSGAQETAERWPQQVSRAFAGASVEIRARWLPSQCS